MKKEFGKLVGIVAIFLAFFFLPFDKEIVNNVFFEGLILLQDYARKHVLLCLIPAFFIAGGILVFTKKDSILKYLGVKTSKWISYPIASLSGGILAVCSCTILPLFAGIWKSGAGIGPATTFLYAGPAINIAAIFLTGTVLGWELSFVRLAFSIIGAIIIGLLMNSFFPKKYAEKTFMLIDERIPFSKSSIALFFSLQLAFLITGSLPISPKLKMILMPLYVVFLLILIFMKFDKDHNKLWISETWDFTKKILPLLFLGIFIAGVLFQLIPQNIVQKYLGQNRLFSNFFASIFGALMYFATLTEVPIIKELMRLGMGKGPALALFLSGYSLSLPNMIVITKLMGFKRAISYILLIVIYSTLAGFVYGNFMFQ
jgi:uncharacterized protein